MAHILIVDDSPTDVHALGQMLGKHGHRISSASNATDGITMAKSEHPDLILMDVIMPGMNGFQATRALSRDPATQAIPIMIVTTKDMETDRVWGLRQGAKDYIVKPVSERDLVARINQLLQG